MPLSYTLNLSFSKSDLTLLYATSSNVIVAKPSASGGEPDVAWIAFRPFEANVMTWVEQYGIYASNVSLRDGAVLEQMSRSEFPAVDGKTYQFSESGFFGPPSPGGNPGSFYTQNSYANAQKYLTFGLFQDAVVNGKQVTGSAVSAALVPLSSKAQMTPFTTLYLWTASKVQSNSVVTLVTSAKTEVTFGGGVTNISLAYDAESGIFTHQGVALPEGVAVAHQLPSVI